MKKMTVSEYARLTNKSVQAIYLDIKKQKLKAEIIDKKTFVYVENIEQKETLNSSKELLKLENEMLKELLKSKEAEIDTLKKSLSVFTIFLNNSLTEKPTVQDIEIIKSKKRKKKRKN